MKSVSFQQPDSLTDSELTDLENANSHSVVHGAVGGDGATLPGQPGSKKGRSDDGGAAKSPVPRRRKGKLGRQNTMAQSLDLYETLENNDKLLTSGPSCQLWDKWQQLDLVRSNELASIIRPAPTL